MLIKTSPHCHHSQANLNYSSSENIIITSSIIIIIFIIKITTTSFFIIISTNLLNSRPDDKVRSGEYEKRAGEEESEVDGRHQEACARALR